jgi:L-ascorbate metabolism protein UlaG (beta-lactamase superfamily)
MRPILRLLPLIIALGASVGCYAPTVQRTRTYQPSDADLIVTRIVHGSAVIDFPETKILLDPWYNPTPPFGPSEPMGLSLDNLPPMRGILITHKHSDHLDDQTLAKYPDKSLRVIVPPGLGAKIRAMGYQDVVELEHWDRSQLGSVIVTAVPSKHSVPENGYVLQGNSVTLYVAGDTLFDEQIFQEIHKRFPNIDAALLPVGGIRIMGERLDMSPEEAAEAFAILKPHRAIPYHYGLTGPFPFILTTSAPEKAFRQAVASQDPAAGNAVVILEPGRSWHHYRQ